MSFGRQAILVLVVSLASIASAASAPADMARAHNLILIIPEVLPAVGIDPATAPALTRLRHEGVDFTNSHSGFPKLTGNDPFSLTPDLNVESLVAAAAARYSTAFIDDTRLPVGEASASLHSLLNGTLPQFKEANRPFLLIYRLAEPTDAPPRADGSRPAYKPSARVADGALASIEACLKSLGLFEKTNIVVAAEHALTRVLKVSHTSGARDVLPKEETLGTLPPGFLAVDLLVALRTIEPTLDLFDPDNGNAYVAVKSKQSPTRGNGIIAWDFEPSRPYVTIEAHGAHDSIHFADSLTKEDRRTATAVIVEAVLEQDYLGGVFVNERRVGRVRGALSMTALASEDADEEMPDIVVAFASSNEGCAQPLACTSVIADTPLAEGEGIPNGFSRAGTRTFMAARGPDFRARFADSAPASNADVSRTVAELLDLEIDGADRPKGRVLTESLAGERNRAMPRAQSNVRVSKPAADGSVTQVRMQSLGSRDYFDSMRSWSEARFVLDGKPRWRWHLPRIKSFTISISGDED